MAKGSRPPSTHLRFLPATRLLVLFEDETDANRCAVMLPERLAKFGLEVASEKTQFIAFGAKFWPPGLKTTSTFDRLGFTCAGDPAKGF